MLDIAICDDDPGQLELLASFTAEYMQKHHIGTSIQQFLHPDALLRSCEMQRFHIYILDIVMPMFNGIEVGKTIREHDQSAFILYTTSEPGFALQSFEAKPFDYLLKPIEKQLSHETLHRVVAKLAKTDDGTWVIKTREGMRVLRLSEILYCEYRDHTVTYTLMGAKTLTTKVIKGSFSNHIECLLQDERFLRPHVSFVVNMDYIEGFSKTRFTLRGGYMVPITTKHYPVVRDTYMNYLAKQRHI